MKKNLKIGILVDQLIPGGVQKAAVEEVRHLRFMGLDAKLLILMSKGSNNQLISELKGIPYEFFTDRYPKILRHTFKLPFFTFLSNLHLLSPLFSLFIVNNNEYDILISHGTTTTLTAWSLSKWRDIPYLTVIHDPMIYILDKVYSKTPLKYIFTILKPLSVYIESCLITGSLLCLVDSSVHADYLQKSYGVKPQTLYLGIEPLIKISIRRGDSVLAFSRWDKGKNPQDLIKMALSLPKVPFIIAGSWTSDNDLEEFKKNVSNYKLDKQITIFPYITRTDMAGLFQKARVFVHPHFEAFGLGALQAAGFGCPIIIPKGSGVTELFKDGLHGFFPPKDNFQALTNAVKTLSKNPEKANEMGRQAQRIAKQYTWKSHTKTLLKLINSVLN
jgi:glycosyltransferase involved in cell wall biosynthesis